MNNQRANRNRIIWLAVWWAIGMLWVQPPPLAAQTVQPQQAELATVSSYLRTELAATDGPVSFLVILRDQPDLQTMATQARTATAGVGAPQARRQARAQAVYAGLTDYARGTQADLLAWLDAQGAAYRPFYIVNMIEVTGDAALVEALRLHPEIDRIVANPQVAGVEETARAGTAWAQPLAFPSIQPAATAAPAFTYGLLDTNVPDVWEQGVRGQGIIIAGQDTGVEWTHPALLGSYRGWDGQSVDHTYNWFDAWAGSSADQCAGSSGPCDDTGHGTHTLGTVVGENAENPFGVAPDAQWIACRNMLSGFGTPTSYATCFQFFLAPYPSDGDPFRDGRPDLAPHIINNSWGCPPYEGCDAESLRAVTAAMRAAGQLVVASAGNSGPACSTVDDPISIYADVLTVGAYGTTGVVASFSSRGPVNIDGSGLLKPDLTAPGVGVLSAVRGGTLGTLSGTSMAAPHVAGAAALLWSAVPDLVGEPERTIQILLKSTVPVTDSACMNGAVADSPNPTYGYGRLDVAAALHLADTPWQVAVQVADAEGAPLGGAVVTWIDGRTGYTQTTTTTFDGVARFAVVYSGVYSLRVTESSSEPSAGLDAPAINLSDGAGEVEGTAGTAALHVVYRAQQTLSPRGPHLYYLPMMNVTEPAR